MNTLMWIMSIVALITFISLYYVRAGYGMFRTPQWGMTINSRLGWVIMEATVFLVMMWMWWNSDARFETVPLIFFLLFELHYLQRSFIFPLVMKGKSRMPILIMLMAVLFNTLNGFMQGEWLFYSGENEFYSVAWLLSPWFIIGTILFFSGMVINIHSDSVIRGLRKPNDTRHYLPQKGMFRYVTSANYFGECLEWVGFAILTCSPAAWVFAWWTFANLAPRADAIRTHYRKEFGETAVGKRKRMIPFIY